MATVVLLVEVDRLTRRSIAALLRLKGYIVYEAENGAAAVELLSSTEFDFIISDLNLPGQLDGIDVLDLTKKTFQKIDVMLITAVRSDEIEKRVHSLGVCPRNHFFLDQTQEIRSVAAWRSDIVCMNPINCF